MASLRWPVSLPLQLSMSVSYVLRANPIVSRSASLNSVPVDSMPSPHCLAHCPNTPVRQPTQEPRNRFCFLSANRLVPAVPRLFRARRLHKASGPLTRSFPLLPRFLRSTPLPPQRRPPPSAAAKASPNGCSPASTSSLPSCSPCSVPVPAKLPGRSMQSQTSSASSARPPS